MNLNINLEATNMKAFSVRLFFFTLLTAGGLFCCSMSRLTENTFEKAKVIFYDFTNTMGSFVNL